MANFLDRGALLIAAMVCAVISWAFWHFLGEDAFDVFALLFMLCLLLENYSLKKEVKKLKCRVFKSE